MHSSSVAFSDIPKHLHPAPFSFVFPQSLVLLLSRECLAMISVLTHPLSLHMAVSSFLLFPRKPLFSRCSTFSPAQHPPSLWTHSCLFILSAPTTAYSLSHSPLVAFALVVEVEENSSLASSSAVLCPSPLFVANYMLPPPTSFLASASLKPRHLLSAKSPFVSQRSRTMW